MLGGGAAGGRAGERESSDGVLRSLLGAYLGLDPASLRFERGEHGKPRLAETAASRLAGGAPHFNLSHSGGLTVVAISRRWPVGIDLELPGQRRDYLALARRAFGAAAAERLRRLAAERREREFLRLWTRHEARLKCLGGGLSFGRLENPRMAPWVVELELGVSAVAALASTQRPGAIRLADRL